MKIIIVMKKLTVLKAFMVVLVAFAALSLTSCNNDSYEPVPVKLGDVNGNYKAKLITTQGIIRTEKIIEFAAKDTLVTFKEFPIREIVKSVVKDPAKTETALTAIGKVEYKLNYTPKINVENNVVELTFVPKKLTIQIPVDGATKSTVVTLSAKQKGLFIGQDRSLRYSLVAEKIIVDGVELAPFETIKYDFPYSLKN
jgi:hypothetical protein